MNPRVVAAGVDTLELAFRCKLREDLIAELRAAKDRARFIVSLPKDMPRPEAPLVSIGGFTWAIAHYATKRSELYGVHEDALLGVAPNPPGPAPNVYLAFRSHKLWADGLRAVWTDAQALVDELAGPGAPVESLVSRMDLAVDVAGWVPRLEELQHFVTRADYRSVWCNEPPPAGAEEAFVRGRQFTGFRFGAGGPVVLRIYDKLLEIARQSGKTWFEDVWAKACEPPEPGEPVWRVEMQLRREFLKEFHVVIDGGLRPPRSAEDTFASIGQLWEYCVGGEREHGWTTLRVPAVGERPARWDVSWPWRVVQAGAPYFEQMAPVPVVRERRRQATKAQMASMALGVLTTAGALAGAAARARGEHRRLGLHEAMDPVLEFIEERLDQRGLTYHQLVDEKEATQA